MKVARYVILNNIDFHDQPSRMNRSHPRSRQQYSNSKKKKTGAAGGTSKYYGNMVLGCLFIVFRLLLYEINRSKLKKSLDSKLFQDLLKKMLKFIIFSFFIGLAAPEDIIQMTSDHVSMLIRTFNIIWHYSYVKIQQFFFSIHPIGYIHISMYILHIRVCRKWIYCEMLLRVMWKRGVSKFE